MATNVSRCAVGRTIAMLGTLVAAALLAWTASARAAVMTFGSPLAVPATKDTASVRPSSNFFSLKRAIRRSRSLPRSGAENARPRVLTHVFLGSKNWCGKPALECDSARNTS